MSKNCLVILFLIFSYSVPAISDPSTPNPAPVIGHLHARDKIVTISSGVSGPIYSVKSLDGNILAELLSIYELYSQFPSLEEVVKRGIAGNDASLGPDYMRKSRQKTGLSSKPWDSN